MKALILAFLARVGFNTKTEGELQNVKWPTSLITRHQPITID
jgi:hypothetical protein